MSRPGVEELVSSLLYEGYALYPYTPGATKNATPTPFGIVYPPGYAETQPAAFAMARLDAVLIAGPEAELHATVRFLQAAGERHKASERRLELGPLTLAALAALERGTGEEFRFEAEGEGTGVSGRIRMRAELLGPDLARVRLCVHNDTPIEDPAGATRAEALRHSLLSVHPLLEVEGGRFASPLERDGEVGAAVSGCEPVNTFPVLAEDGDRAVLGAAIVLPEHPELAPESIGNLFDNTEIEEALLLHVQTLSDLEQDSIGEQDPAVREMIQRAQGVSGEEMLGLHGRLTFKEPDEGEAADEPVEANAHRQPPPGSDEIQGEEETEVSGLHLRRGDKVVLRPGTDGDVFDRILHGRTATIERIYRGYDERIYLGVTVDDDPGQELLRETGRYLFFFGDEVEVKG
ncbi:MAG TPA: hypothetical protein VHH72_03335 [Solirubrobacterales bacterium]|jgi:hypothetical protein|nr:hypothetical protein [Solirubrobacterales bacterium]